MAKDGSMVSTYLSSREIDALDTWRAETGQSRYAVLRRIVRERLAQEGYTVLSKSQEGSNAEH